MNPRARKWVPINGEPTSNSKGNLKITQCLASTGTKSNEGLDVIESCTRRELKSKMLPWSYECVPYIPWWWKSAKMQYSSWWRHLHSMRTPRLCTGNPRCLMISLEISWLRLCCSHRCELSHSSSRAERKRSSDQRQELSGFRLDTSYRRRDGCWGYFETSPW